MCGRRAAGGGRRAAGGGRGEGLAPADQHQVDVDPVLVDQAVALERLGHVGAPTFARPVSVASVAR
ncbi:hypothetical protein KCMC57_up12430 [Kitasatospora sp. CMC57]|uniref:Uncharacterized protein n=1 Tax=Kitasatospora sp. CMC57 TaxID=3231513 RepID=A0AB33JQ05_9ACTN